MMFREYGLSGHDFGKGEFGGLWFLDVWEWYCIRRFYHRHEKVGESNDYEIDLFRFCAQIQSLFV